MVVFSSGAARHIGLSRGAFRGTGKTMETITKLLALETTDVSGSVALCDGGQIVGRRFLASEQRSAQTLAPTIKALLQEYGWKPSEVDVVGVAVGPGSFTGLRVGVTTGKMFAWATNARIVGVDALDVVVESIVRSDVLSATAPSVLSVGIDAQRGDAAVRRYLVVNGAVVPLDERFRVVSIKSWLGSDAPVEELLAADARVNWEKSLKSLSTETVEVLRRTTARDVIYAGPALRRVRNLAENFPSLRLAPEELWNPDAVGVAFVAWNRATSGIFDDVWNILPVYSRRAAAEEKALAKVQTNASTNPGR